MSKKQQVDTTEQTVKKGLNTKHIVWPVLFGLIGIVWMIFNEFSQLGDSPVPLSHYITNTTIWFLLLSVALIVIRDLSGMGRLYLLADKKLGFGALFRIRMLYEFTSAVTPSAAGGSTLEMIFINREGISFGRSTAICIMSLFLDELSLVLLFPLVFLFFPIDIFFQVAGEASASIASLFAIGYFAKLIWVSILFVGIFVKPQVISWLISRIFSIKWLKKWKLKAFRTAVDIKACSKEMRHKSAGFFIANILLSMLLWVSRFLIVNALIMAFVTASDSLTFVDQVIIAVRQGIVLVVMMIAPTPGGSGFIEVMFETYLGEFIPVGMVSLIIVSVWRMLTYYNYLIIGAIITPKWIAKHFSRKKQGDKEEN